MLTWLESFKLAFALMSLKSELNQTIKRQAAENITLKTAPTPATKSTSDATRS